MIARDNGSAITCPCCSAVKVRDIGRLQDSHWFAGDYHQQPLAGGRLYSCSACGMKFRHPLLEPERYSQMYADASTEIWDSPASRIDFELITEVVRAELKRGGRILDYGCYTGELLSRFGAAYETYGVEINKTAAVVASGRISGRIWSSLAEIPVSERFDVIIASDVIEHMENPVVALANMAEKLESGGLMLLTTGNANAFLWRLFGANWWYCFYPEHVRFFSETTLAHVASMTGLSIVRLKQFRHSGLGWARRLSDGVQACWYGLFPTSYMAIMNWVGRIRGRSSSPSGVPGNGVTRDHLFLVLKRVDDAHAS